MAGFAAFLAACTGTKSSTAPSEAAASAGGPSVRAVRRAVGGADREGRDGTAQVRQLAGLHRPDDRGRRRYRRPAGRLLQDAGGLQDEVRGGGRLRGEDRRQPDLLRDDPAGPRRRARDRLGPGRPDRLDGGQDHRQELGRADRPGERPQLRQQPARRAARPDVGSEQRLPLSVAVGHDRDRLQHQDAGREQHRRADQDRRPVVDPGRQADLPDGGARHVRPRAAQARHRAGSGAR